jgi:hypothetical protein
MTARVLNVIFGGFLMLSSILWPHTRAQFWNALGSGALIIGIAMAAGDRARGARYGNTIVGLWLVVSTLVLPTASRPTLWVHFVIGGLVFVLSLVPTGPRLERARAGGAPPL